MERYILRNKISKKKRKVVFLTGTRADFGKIKPLVSTLLKSRVFDVHLFVTGMHVATQYGYTVDEIIKCGFPNIYQFDNNAESSRQDLTLANTLIGFSSYIKLINPDMIVVHGDRIEAFAGAIVGAVNNILVAHIEGGEMSGSIDDSIRHSISKMAHMHFVANGEAKRRLIQMGEEEKTIFAIGSPDMDVMSSKDLPTIEKTRSRYGINFNSYSILLIHPVTSELKALRYNTNILVNAICKSELNYIIIYPNNDPGTDVILDILRERTKNNSKIRFFPSIRFEHFLTLIRNANFIIGNSSAGVREAPFYGIPSIDVGTRQNNRVKSKDVASVFHCDYKEEKISKLINRFGSKRIRFSKNKHFGIGSSAGKFLTVLKKEYFWDIKTQKQFFDLVF